jgi:hypothetical protein
MKKLSKKSVLLFAAVMALAAFAMPAMASAAPTWSGSGTVAVTSTSPASLTLNENYFGTVTCNNDVSGTVEGGGTAGSITQFAPTNCVSATFGAVIITTSASASNPWPTSLGCSGSTIISTVSGILVTVTVPALGVTGHYSANGAGAPATMVPTVANTGASSIGATFNVTTGTLNSDLGTSLTIGGVLGLDGASIVGSC